VNKLRVGVIGVGHLGKHHARLYASLPGVALVGVTDANPERARLMAEQHGTIAYPSLTALLSDIEAVSVAVPTSAHYPVVKSCLEAGVHVLVEKPIAASSAEARDLVDVAHKRSCVLQVGHVERFNPIIRAVRPRIQRPAFIECHRLAPFGERGTDVDVVLDLMIHDLDMVLSFDPGPVEEVRAAGVAVLSPNIDIANARIAFASGCVANLTASRVSTNRMRRLRVFQRDAYITVDYQTRQGAILRRVAGAGPRPTIEAEQVQGSDDEPLKLELEAFVRAITDGTPPPVSGEDGAAALELAQQVTDAVSAFVRRHEGGESRG